MQTSPIGPYTVDELKRFIGTENYEDSLCNGMSLAPAIINHLVNECHLTFFTITDYSKMKFCLVSPNVEQVIGYPNKMFVIGGLEFMFSLQHPDESESLRLIHKKIICFFNSLPVADRLSYSYSYDVRVRRADGEFVRLLCQLDFQELDDNHHVLYGKETFTDITLYTRIPSITLTIRHKDQASGIPDIVHYIDAVHAGTPLSKREKEVSELVNQGLSSKEIGAKLNLSKHTIDTHRRRIRRK